jgi:hypothetical protein
MINLRHILGQKALSAIYYALPQLSVENMYCFNFIGNIMHKLSLVKFCLHNLEEVAIWLIGANALII